MKGPLAAPLLLLALGPLGTAHGQQLFKCVSAAGKTSYQEEPCQATPGKDQPVWLAAFLMAFLALIPVLVAVALAWFTASAPPA